MYKGSSATDNLLVSQRIGRNNSAHLMAPETRIKCDDVLDPSAATAQ